MRVKGVSVICALEKKINIKGMREREREKGALSCVLQKS